MTSGTVTDSYTYDAFGAMTAHTGTNPQPFGYAGQQQDVGAEGGMLYLRARYYAPALGRFLTQDPLPSAQRYSYAGSDPVNLTDPSGLFPCPGCSGIRNTAVRGAHAVKRYAESVDWQTTGIDALGLGCTIGVVAGTFAAGPAGLGIGEGCVFIASSLGLLRTANGADSCSITAADYAVGISTGLAAFVPGVGVVADAFAVGWDLGYAPSESVQDHPAPGCDSESLSASASGPGKEGGERALAQQPR